MGLRSVDIGQNSEGGLAFQEIFKVICYFWFFTSILLFCHFDFSGSTFVKADNAYSGFRG